MIIIVNLATSHENNITEQDEILAKPIEVSRDTVQGRIQHVAIDMMAVDTSQEAFSRPCSET